MSLEIDLATKQGYWHALNIDTDEELERQLDMSSLEDWEWFAGQVRSSGGVAE